MEKSTSIKCINNKRGYIKNGNRYLDEEKYPRGL